LALEMKNIRVTQLPASNSFAYTGLP